MNSRYDITPALLQKLDSHEKAIQKLQAKVKELEALLDAPVKRGPGRPPTKQEAA